MWTCRQAGLYEVRPLEDSLRPSDRIGIHVALTQCKNGVYRISGDWQLLDERTQLSILSSETGKRWLSLRYRYRD
jgi:hypothetical protein